MKNIGVGILENKEGLAPVSFWVREFSALGSTLHFADPLVEDQNFGLSSREVQDIFSRIVCDLAEVTDPLPSLFSLEKAPDNCDRLSLTALVVYALASLGFRYEDAVVVRPALVASVLGEAPHTQAYHNTVHFRKVLQHTVRLIRMHNSLADEMEPLSQEQMVLLLTAACIHDLGHDGSGNVQAGQYEPGRLELQSSELAEPYLSAAGMSEGMMTYLRTMVLCTDASRPDNPSCPLTQLKAAFHHHFAGSSGKAEHTVGQIFSFLSHRADLTLLSMYLHEADIMSSAGVSYEKTRCETILFKRERGEGAARPSDVLEFFDTICRGGFLSKAGQALAQKPFETIRAAVEKDFEMGNAVYQQDTGSCS
ncbi:MAG: hypothetical protein H6858_02985 [Rhodospirillales bacterium]|nr:hypothetical protein [Alphaproteobacteria bacterium]MCB1839924.1 hypothetical protein [Alphaproteobacteria bacterium]MCB9976548.1 hypothetical protein [Rhodospirillales bacterium]